MCIQNINALIGHATRYRRRGARLGWDDPRRHRNVISPWSVAFMTKRYHNNNRNPRKKSKHSPKQHHNILNLTISFIIRNMPASNLPVTRALIRSRVAPRQYFLAQTSFAARGRALYTTTQCRQQLDNEDLRDDGTSGRFNKSGSSPNNNLAYDYSFPFATSILYPTSRGRRCQSEEQMTNSDA